MVWLKGLEKLSEEAPICKNGHSPVRMQLKRYGSVARTQLDANRNYIDNTDNIDRLVIDAGLPGPEGIRLIGEAAEYQCPGCSLVMTYLDISRVTHEKPHVCGQSFGWDTDGDCKSIVEAPLEEALKIAIPFLKQKKEK